jgi:hypothetical protein
MQNFDFSYELAWKIMCVGLFCILILKCSYKKKNLFRMAFKYNLIKNSEDWYEYYENKNIIFPAHDEAKADLWYIKLL